MKELTRREFIKKSGLTLLTASSTTALSGCLMLPVKIGVDHDPIIDSHTHIFNSRDLQQMVVMIQHGIAWLNNEVVSLPEILNLFLTTIGRAIAHIIERFFEIFTPTYNRETNVLNKIFSSSPDFNFYDESKTFAASTLLSAKSFQDETLYFSHDVYPNQIEEVENDSLFEELFNTFEKSVIEDYTKKSGLHDVIREDIELIQEYLTYRKRKVALFKADATLKSTPEMLGIKSDQYQDFQSWDKTMSDQVFEEIFDVPASDLKSLKGVISDVYDVFKYLKAFLILKALAEFLNCSIRSHIGNAKRLRKLFKNAQNIYHRGNGADHFVTASVDMDYWTKSATDGWWKQGFNHTLEQQYALIEKTSLAMKGAIMPMVAFDPWREYDYREKNTDLTKSPLEVIKKLILNHGFIGIKIYPPMGFKPIDNASTTNWPSDLPYHRDRKFGEIMDTCLKEIYQFCVDQDVPIMAHASPSMYSRPEFEHNSSPDNWRKVLIYVDPDTGHMPFKNLRLNLAHSGGIDGVRHQGSWTMGIVDLCLKYDNVYMDLSNFDDIHKKGNRKGIQSFFSKLGSNAKRKILYGSDWWMLAKYQKKRKYLAYNLQVSNSMTYEEAADFMGNNCLRFLGFSDPSNKNAIRFREFFEGHGITPPEIIAS